MSGGAYLGHAELRKKNHHFNIRHLAKIAKAFEIEIEYLFREKSYCLRYLENSLNKSTLHPSFSNLLNPSSLVTNKSALE